MILCTNCWNMYSQGRGGERNAQSIRCRLTQAHLLQHGCHSHSLTLMIHRCKVTQARSQQQRTHSLSLTHSHVHAVQALTLIVIRCRLTQAHLLQHGCHSHSLTLMINGCKATQARSQQQRTHSLSLTHSHVHAVQALTLIVIRCRVTQAHSQQHRTHSLSLTYSHVHAVQAPTLMAIRCRVIYATLAARTHADIFLCSQGQRHPPLSGCACCSVCGSVHGGCTSRHPCDQRGAACRGLPSLHAHHGWSSIWYCVECGCC